MSAECYPMTMLPHISRLYEDFLGDAGAVRGWYGAAALGGEWMGRGVGVGHAGDLADALKAQSMKLFGVDPTHHDETVMNGAPVQGEGFFGVGPDSSR